MTGSTRTLLALIAAAAMASGATAQDTTTQADDAAQGADAEQTAPAPSAEAAAAPDENGIGRAYTRETFGSWEMRCVRTEDGLDPCQLYQLLRDQNGNSVAEISVFPLPPGQPAVAGATLATPLDTLLSQQVTISVDGRPGKRYPFTYCSPQGCFARIGFEQPDLDLFKRGANAEISIVPLAAPTERVNLKLSLTGFTAGFEAVRSSNAELAQQ